MISKIISWWRRRRLRKAQEKLAKWKGRYEELLAMSRNPLLYTDTFHLSQRVEAAGKLFLYTERVECLMREPHIQL